MANLAFSDQEQPGTACLQVPPDALHLAFEGRDDV
jgi:hypothetical protein